MAYDWLAELQCLTDEYLQAFDSLNAAQINWKPNAASWSIGQVVDHVVMVNETYFPLIKQLKNGTYQSAWTAKLPFLVRFFGNFILNGVEPQRKRKVKTFPIWEPSQSEVPGGIVRRFAEHQKKLAELMISCEKFIEAGAVISSPANRFIVYKLETAFNIIVAHERRHLNQALEVLGAMKKASI